MPAVMLYEQLCLWTGPYGEKLEPLGNGCDSELESGFSSLHITATLDNNSPTTYERPCAGTTLLLLDS